MAITKMDDNIGDPPVAPEMATAMIVDHEQAAPEGSGMNCYGLDLAQEVR
jgi:hypothetical protein